VSQAPIIVTITSELPTSEQTEPVNFTITATAIAPSAVLVNAVFQIFDNQTLLNTTVMTNGVSYFIWFGTTVGTLGVHTLRCVLVPDINFVQSNTASVKQTIRTILPIFEVYNIPSLGTINHIKIQGKYPLTTPTLVLNFNQFNTKPFFNFAAQGKIGVYKLIDIIRIPAKTTVTESFSVANPVPTYLYCWKWPAGVYTFAKHPVTRTTLGAVGTLKKVKTNSVLTVKTTFSGILEFPIGTKSITWKGVPKVANATLEFTLGIRGGSHVPL